MNTACIVRIVVFRLLVGSLLWFCCGQAIAQPYLPGITYFDSTGFVEYQAGNLPLIISVPHGGYLEPDTIPDRNCSGCSYLRDAYTQELGRNILADLVSKTGCYPHVIINLLHRRKFDANRDIDDAADGNLLVEQSWQAYHAYIDAAKARVAQDYGAGLFLDLHGHAHDIQRIEMGYLFSKTELQLPDSVLNTPAYIQESSIRRLAEENLLNLSHSSLLRGDHSLGSMMEQKGFRSVPSAIDPFPLNNEPYFSGGYNTVRHGSKNGGRIDGIQLELNQAIRFDAVERARFADSLIQALVEYTEVHYHPGFSSDYCGLLTAVSDLPGNHSFLVFPNPAKDVISIKSEGTHFMVEIYNILGQKLYSTNWQGQPLRIDFLENGYYFLVLSKAGALIGSKPFVVE